MDLKLTGKRVFVSGASSGIGIEIAKLFAAEGAVVVANGRDPGRTDSTVRQIREAGGQAIAAIGELTSDEGADAVAEVANKALGGIDILVNNAGGSAGQMASDWFETPPEKWAEVYRQNTLPAVQLTQALVPAMRERGWGRVIHISSRNAISPYPQFGAYGAAKAALNNLTLSLSKALAGTGVTSNGIMPGLIQTPLTEPWFLALAEQLGSKDPRVGQDFALKKVLRQTVTRLGQPRDIAYAVCFIASPLSDFLTGTTFRVDGGATPTV